MTARPRIRRRTKAAPAAAGRRALRWLLFVHQLPSTPSNLRVRTWRRLQELGAIPLKQSVYVLPDRPSAREDFEWLKSEVIAAGGDATVFAADSIDAWSDDALIQMSRQSRQRAYAALADDIERVVKRVRTRRRSGKGRSPAVRRLADLFRERLTAIERIDFFGASGRDRVTTLLAQLDEQGASRRPATRADAPVARDPAQYRKRVWGTRPRPGVDRMASAWLIRRFIDPQARFIFAPDRVALPGRAVPFDMFGVEFSHHGERCTFETLCAAFGLADPALARLAAIVHDLDLKDGRFLASEVPTVGAMIEGLQLAHDDDDALLTHGMGLFEALYQGFRQSARTTRSVAHRTAVPHRR